MAHASTCGISVLSQSSHSVRHQVKCARGAAQTLGELFHATLILLDGVPDALVHVPPVLRAAMQVSVTYQHFTDASKNVRIARPRGYLEVVPM